MIPNLALIISAYVNFRMIEIFLLPTSHYSGRGAHVAARVLAVIVILVTSVCALDILMSGTQPALR